MENKELIKTISEAFLEIVPGKSPEAIKEGITGMVRSVNRLQTQDDKLNLALRALSADLMKLYTNQVGYSELKHKSENPGLKVKPEFDGSFFTSLAILREELLKLLEKI